VDAQRGIQQGIEKGVRQGIAAEHALLLRQIRKRFGADCARRAAAFDKDLPCGSECLWKPWAEGVVEYCSIDHREDQRR